MNAQQPDVDVVVVGAGMAGLYLHHRLREAGMSAVGFETGDDVGGTWYWNRYPGARCDVQSIDYSYSWDPEIEQNWEWSERYATQPEILRYLNFVADKHDLRRDIRFNTRVQSASWDDDAALWTIATDDGETTTCRHYVMATGCLSAMKDPDLDGAGNFEGEVYYTGRWPHEGVDFTGKRVAVIGTGSSGIQSIPLIAKEAKELTVFQRTPNFSLPAHNGPVLPQHREAIDEDREAYREEARWSGAGVPQPEIEEGAMMVDDAERQRRYEKAWEEGTIFAMINSFNDILANPESNATAAQFVRDKIRSIVDDPETAEKLAPQSFPIGTKRLCLDTNYYATYNEDHVSLVDLTTNPISQVTATGIDVVDGDGATSYGFDAIVFATGFDAMTGAIVRVDIAGRDGLELRDKWADGPRTYLGLMTHGFPNLFMITGPQSPSVLSNMAVSIEQHVDWIADTLEKMRDDGQDTIEPTVTAEDGWIQHTTDYGDITLFPQANSWYMGSNVPGKPRVFLPYVGGVDRYRQICTDIVEQDYLGFTLTGSDGVQENDGVICRVAPDVTVLLEVMEELELPEFQTLSPTEAREMNKAMAEQNPPGPEVGEVLDGTYPGAAGDLDYRLYRPSTEGPHPIAVYYHGGGWVLGTATSDDALCRELCNESDSIIVSVDYRHGPEDPFPAAHDDAYAALQWVSDNAQSLGGRTGGVAVAGWSAGGNLATHVCQRARDESGPTIVGQVLLTPVTDSAEQSQSYVDNGEGYILTKALMDYFFEHYAGDADLADPRLSPLRADDLSNLPPAFIVTCEFDPLRDEGNAYAEALANAGVDVDHVQARGQIHTSIPAVGAIISSATFREQMAHALRSFLAAGVPA